MIGGRPWVVFRGFHQSAFYRITMNVPQGCPRIFWQTEVGSWLPYWSFSNVVTHAPLELLQDCSYGIGLGHTEKEMTMIRHDDEAIEKEGVEILDTVQCFNGFPGMTGVGEDRRAIARVRCHEHNNVILNRMIPNHTHRMDGTVFLPGQARISDSGQAFLPDHEAFLPDHEAFLPDQSHAKISAMQECMA